MSINYLVFENFQFIFGGFYIIIDQDSVKYFKIFILNGFFNIMILKILNL